MSLKIEDDHCHYIVPRKKRRCRMLIKPGHYYCGEHRHLQEKPFSETKERENHDRIPCPLDPKHSCAAKSLDKHLKKCPSKLLPSPNYVSNGINVNKDNLKVGGLTLSKSTDEQLLDLISRLNKVYDECIKDKINVEIFKHEIIENELKQDHVGPSASKHLVQNSSLLGHLEALNTFKVCLQFFDTVFCS